MGEQVPTIQSPASLEGLKNEVSRLNEQRGQLLALQKVRSDLEAKDRMLIGEFMAMFRPAMVELKPGIYAIIKPSRRQGVVSGNRIFSGKADYFLDSEGKHVPLEEHEDYIIFTESGGPLQPDDTVNPFVVEVFDELYQK